MLICNPFEGVAVAVHVVLVVLPVALSEEDKAASV
jgi:hypothetical protein